MAILAITREGAEPREVELGEVTIVGRDDTADVPLPSDAVSRHHAKISHTEDGYLVEDLWSRNATFVNRRRIRRHLLKDGDTIDICEFQLVFHPSSGDEGPRGHKPTMVLSDAPDDAETPVEVPVGSDGSVRAPKADTQEVARLRARLELIYEVTDAVDITLSLDESLDGALGKLLEIFPQADVAVLMLRDRHTETMAPRASRLRPGLDPNQVTVSTTVMRQTAERGQALLSTSAAQDPRLRSTLTIQRSSIASLMCVPLLYREEATGLLYVDSRRPGVAFHEDDLALLSWVGKEISLAVERAQMRRELLRRQRVERDMHLAAEVQRSFLPDGPPSIDGYEFALHHVSALGVGGDFYDFLPLGGGRIALVLGDVSGKGISAALLMARLSSHTRFLALQCETPGELLGRLNAMLVERAPRGTFVTMIYGILDARKRQLTLASAGHVSPLRVLPQAEQVEEVDPVRQFPLGALEGQKYEDIVLDLRPGDHVVMYTDGLIDASNAEGEWYGENRLQRVVAGAPRSPQAMLDALLTDLGAFADEAGQTDDATFIVFRVGEGAEVGEQRVEHG
ncbi:SpoIIE family protein phosphatase, partial [Planctomycetota bacterium]